jgi:K+-sensing histidine kinase KdpD
MAGLVRARSKSRSLLVILPCGALAFVLSLLFRDGALKPAAPAIFLLVIILVAHFFGRLASLLVAILSGLVFAGFLFGPYGRFAVYNAADRVVLLLFAVCALAAVSLSKNPEN